MKVTSVCHSNSLDREPLKYLLDSCAISDVDLEVIGVDTDFCLVTKITEFHRFLAGTEDDDIIIYTDAHDAFYVRDHAEIVRRFLRSGRRILFSAERWYSHQLEPDRHFYDELAPASAYRYLNTGGFIGYAKDMKSFWGDLVVSLHDRAFLMEVYPDGVELEHMCDQTVISHFIAAKAGKYGVALDYSCQIFYVAAGDWDDIDHHVVLDNGKLRVVEADAYPCIIHVPWKRKHEATLRDLYEKAHGEAAGTLACDSAPGEVGPVVRVHAGRKLELPGPVPPAPRVGTRSLVYVCVGGRPQYLELLRLLMASLVKYGEPEANVRFLVMTTPDFEDQIGLLPGIEMDVWTFPMTSIFESASGRLRVFEYPEVEAFDRMLYLDVDCLVTNRLSSLFGLELAEDRLYAFPEGNLGMELWGRSLFSDAEYETLDSQRAFSTGVMLFRNALPIRQLFGRCLAHIGEHFESAKRIPETLEQPFVVYNTVTRGMQETELLREKVANNPKDSYRGQTVCHFPGGPGEYERKRDKIDAYLAVLSRRQGSRLTDEIW